MQNVSELVSSLKKKLNSFLSLMADILFHSNLRKLCSVSVRTLYSKEKINLDYLNFFNACFLKKKLLIPLA